MAASCASVDDQADETIVDQQATAEPSEASADTDSDRAAASETETEPTATEEPQTECSGIDDDAALMACSIELLETDFFDTLEISANELIEGFESGLFDDALIAEMLRLEDVDLASMPYFARELTPTGEGVALSLESPTSDVEMAATETAVWISDGRGFVGEPPARLLVAPYDGEAITEYVLDDVNVIGMTYAFGSIWLTSRIVLGIQSGSVSEVIRLDPLSGEIEARIDLGDAIPSRIAATDDVVIVIDTKERTCVLCNSLILIEPASDAVVGTADPGGREGEISVAGGRAWITDWEESGEPHEVLAWNPATGSVDFRISAEADEGLWVAADEQAVWVVGSNGVARQVDPLSGSVVRRVEWTPGNLIKPTVVGGNLYIGNGTLIDGETGVVGNLDELDTQGEIVSGAGSIWFITVAGELMKIPVG